MCNHNPNDNNTTIYIDKKHWNGKLQNPRIYNGICKECHKNFKFIKINNEYKSK